MNRLAAILPASNVLVNVDATSKKRVFEQAGLLFENQHAIARGTVTDNLFARERLGSTGLGHAVAIPHGRIKGLKNPLAAVLRVQQPIPFDAPDDEPVSLLIFLLVPEAATQRHLEILSEIAEMLSDRELRERLHERARRRRRAQADLRLGTAEVGGVTVRRPPVKQPPRNRLRRAAGGAPLGEAPQALRGGHETHLHQRRSAVRSAPRGAALGLDRRPRPPRAPLRR